jgi:lipoprotein-anchoring transpeptidase ErfK/SrfK
VRRSVRSLVVLAAGLALVSGTVVAGAAALRPDRPGAGTVAAEVPLPQLVAASVAEGVQPWTAPLRVEVVDGALTGVTALGPDDEPVEGAVEGGAWTSRTPLVPSAVYRLTGTVRDAAGAEVRRPLVVRTSEPERVVTAALRPGDDAVVGVGQPVVVLLDGPVQDAAARRAVLERLSVESRPAVRGAWRWLSPTELHWRPAEFWPAGTAVDVRAELEGLRLPGGAWGKGLRTSSFTVGDAVVSTVDVAAHTLTVTRNGEVLRVLPASMGTPENPTRGGTHLVLEKDAARVMDSDTVGLPGAYRLDVEWAVRLTFSGTFTHAAPWSVADQGVRNVSHGCINLSPADAKWFYDVVRRGDVVQVVGTDVPPLPDDPGSVDWNVPFEEWQRG